MRRAPFRFVAFLVGLLVIPCAVRAGEDSGPGASLPAMPAKLSESLGYLPPRLDRTPRIAIRDVEIPIEHPMLAGERIILSTVGVEHETEGVFEFHPLVSVLIDKTFPEAPGGEWLAFWNLGKKSPGALSRLRATIPGWTASKKVRKREYRAVDRKLQELDGVAASGKIEFPDPLYTLHQKHDRSTAFLVLQGIRNVLNFTKIPYPALLFLRAYLIQRKDLQEREFEQAYLGLTWYTDLAMASEEGSELSPEAIEELKFRLLTNRHMLGRWADPRASENFVHAFESEMRDHLWGTSCYLASAANEYHLGYEEFHRDTTSGVPLALGGLLYYDPELAPEPSQVRWSAFNPFDLSYNPFTSIEVQKAAASGRKVPLAIYVYQSNLALKPIIVVDFFRPNNPRLRESATYWRRVGNEALSAWGAFGYFYTWARRGVGFLANRKGLTYFTDKKHAFGIEELRLSLMSHLYFDKESADELADSVDRLVINPLVQPARLQGLRSELHHRTLLADDGKALVSLARRVRGKSVRKTLGKEDRSRLFEEDYEAYRAQLRKQVHIKRLELFMTDTQVPSRPMDQIMESVEALGQLADGRDSEATDVLMRLWVDLNAEAKVVQLFGATSPEPSASLLAATARSLGSIYAAIGRTHDDLEADFSALAQKRAEDRARERKEWERKHAEEFSEELKVRISFLKAFLGSEVDLNRFSPWYVNEALEFLRHVPEIVAANPRASEPFEKQRELIEQLLFQTEERLASADVRLRAEWLEAERLMCLDSARRVRLQLATLSTQESLAARVDSAKVESEVGMP